MPLFAINQVMKKIMQWKLQDIFNDRSTLIAQNYWANWELGAMT